MPDPAPPLPNSPNTPLLPLGVTSLCYQVDRDLLLDNIEVTIDSPGITTILGPNGAGKSLFLRLIHGLLSPTSGQVRWNDRELDVETRRRQAMVFQKPVLMRRSVAANIDFVLQTGGDERRRRCDKILQQAGLFRQRHQPARLLSGGEQQRLALARAFATNPDVLFLDEPCASVDPGTTLQIEQLLQQAREQGLKIILVTHDIGQARRLADDVLFMHNGHLLEYRNAPDFFKNPESTAARAYLEGKLVL